MSMCTLPSYVGGQGRKQTVLSLSALAEKHKAQSQFPQLFIMKWLLLAFETTSYRRWRADSSDVQANLQPITGMFLMLQGRRRKRNSRDHFILFGKASFAALLAEDKTCVPDTVQHSTLQSNNATDHRTQSNYSLSFHYLPALLSHSARLSLYSALMRVLGRASHFMSSCPQEQTQAKDLVSVVRCLPRSLCICLSSVLPCENVIIRSRVSVCVATTAALALWF